MTLRGDVAEGRMWRFADRGKAVHRHTETRQAIRQVDSAAARLDGGDDDFAQAALTSGGSDHRSEGADVRHRREVIQCPALTHHGDHLVHEAVEARHDAAAP